MVKLNREYILKTFLGKIREAKRADMKELKIPMKFLDDLAFVIVQLMTEELSKAYNAIEFKPKEEVKEPVTLGPKRILKELKVSKPIIENKVVEQPSEEKKEETIKVILPNGLNEKSEPTTYTAEVPLPKIEEAVKEIEEKKNEEIVVNDIEKEDEEDDNNTNIMYGGTW